MLVEEHGSDKWYLISSYFKVSILKDGCIVVHSIQDLYSIFSIEFDRFERLQVRY